MQIVNKQVRRVVFGGLMFFAAVSSLFTAPAQAAFVDDFESYPAGASTLGAPWVPGFQFGVLGDIHATSGYGGTQGFHNGASDWNDGDRATNYDSNALTHVLSWKARLTNANGIPRLTVGIGNGGSGGTTLFWEYEGYIAQPSNFRTGRLNQPGGQAAWEAAGRDVWQQITITLSNDGANNWSWSGEIANENDNFASSVPLGTNVAIPAGFLPTTVSLQSIYAHDEGPTVTSTLDDLSFQSIPEPGSLVLLGLGGLLAIRRRHA
jgi:hypothetical protein